MKKLAIHIIIVACLFFVMDRIFGIGLGYLYRISNTTDEYKISYSNESTRDSLLFIGSSRCLHHYAPLIFEKELGMTCFNAADWGIKNIYFHYGLLGNILSRYTPKEIVFEVHPCDFLDTPYSGTERAGSLAPYCGYSGIKGSIAFFFGESSLSNSLAHPRGMIDSIGISKEGGFI